MTQIITRTRQQFIPLSLALIGTACLTAPTQADVIGVQFIGDGRAAMASDDLAGAPGVRTGNWNNLSGASLDGTAIDDDGLAIGGGFTVTPSDTNYGNRGNTSGLDNDQFLFNSIKDISGSYTVAVTNVPYDVYDVYVYMRDDSDDRAGSYTIGGTTYYLRGLTGGEGGGDPDSSGNGYELSTDTTVGTGADIDQGNYVVFSGLTASDFSLVATAVNAGDSVNRNKFAGFQIVEVPEPSSLALLAMGGLLMARRRRA